MGLNFNVSWVGFNYLVLWWGVFWWKVSFFCSYRTFRISLSITLFVSRSCCLILARHQSDARNAILYHTTSKLWEISFYSSITIWWSLYLPHIATSLLVCTTLIEGVTVFYGVSEPVSLFIVRLSCIKLSKCLIRSQVRRSLWTCTTLCWPRKLSSFLWYF